MRRHLLSILSLTAMLAVAPMAAHAQMGGGRGGSGGGEEEDGAKKKKKDEWEDKQAPLPSLRNAGPCPFVKVLYDAGRYIEFAENREAAANVGFTGEIQGISAGCKYVGAEPIHLEMEVLFALGKGPRAQGDNHTYNYWIAVTDRNRTVLAKENFSLPANFKGGDRVMMTDRISSISIPRAAETVSGANFEVLIGFEVTPQMAEFNREGKRFRVNAGSATAATGASTSPGASTAQ